MLKAVWALTKETFRRWVTDGAFEMSAAIAFYAAFSMAPAMVILVALVALVYGGNTAAELQAQASGSVGPEAAELIGKAIASTTNRVGGGRGPTIIAIITMLLGGSFVFAELLTAMNRVWRVKAKPGRGFRGLLRDRFWPFTLVVVIGGVLLVSLVTSASIQVYSIYFTRLLPGTAFVWHYVDLAASFVIITILFALVYKFLPDVRVAWSDIWVGAIVTSLLFSVGKHLFSLYLGRTALVSIYGAAGSVFVILIWVYFSTAILLLGAEFTCVYAERHGHDVVPKPHAVRIESAFR